MDEMFVSNGVLPNATVILSPCFLFMFFLFCFIPSPLMKVLPYYIVILYLILPSTCLSSSFVLEFLSPCPQLSDFLGVKVVENTVQRPSPH